MVSTEMNQGSKPFCVEKASILNSRMERLQEDTLPAEKRDSDILTCYMAQLKDLPPLSAEAERRLCREIKQKEKEIVDFVAHWFDLIENHLSLRSDLLIVKPKPQSKFSINYYYSGNGSCRLKGILLQLEKINALKKELKQIKSLLHRSNKKIPNLADWREAKEKGEAEISKLISRIKLDGKKVKKVLHQLEIEARKEGRHTEDWEQIEKELEGILNKLDENLLWVRKKKSELIQSHLILVIHVAKRYRNRGMDFLDLIQEGNQGLMRAVDTFDYRRGNRFISYAIWWIRQSIIRAIHNQSRTMRIPIYLFDRLNHYLSVLERLSQEKGREPTPGELAEEMRVSVDHVVELTHIFKTSLPLEDYNQFQVEKKWENGNIEPILEMTVQSDLKRKVDSFLAGLSPRESEVIRLRFGIDGKHCEHSLQEIGQKFNLSRERIRQVERSALIKLRKMSHIQELREFLN